MGEISAPVMYDLALDEDASENSEIRVGYFVIKLKAVDPFADYGRNFDVSEYVIYLAIDANESGRQPLQMSR